MAAKIEDGSSARVPGAAEGAGERLRAAPPAAAELEPEPPAERAEPVPPELGPEDEAVVPDTLPPTPLKSLLAAGGANLYVLSNDPGLIDVATRASGEQYPMFAVSEWHDLEAAVKGGECGIALVDADTLGTRLTARLKWLGAYRNRVVVLVAAERAVAQDLMALLSERKIHRLLIKPPAVGITRLLLESAVKRRLQLRELAGEPGSGSALPPPKRRARSATALPFWMLASGVAALLGGVAIIATYSAWRPALQSSRPAAAAAAPAPTITSEPPATEGADAAAAEEVGGTEAAAAAEVPARFAVLLANAEAAFREGRLAEPPGDNALDHYLAILAAEPTEPTARAQLAQVVDALYTQAEAALLADDLDAAAATLANVRRADASSGRLAFLEAQLERMRAAAAAAAAAADPAAIAAAAAANELASQLTIARSRLARGQLITPRGDSARDYLARALQLGPDDAEVGAVRSELAEALLTAARDALAAGELAASAEFATEARRLGAAAAAVTGIEADINSARATAVTEQHALWLANARSRLENAALIAPAEDNALYWLERLQTEAPDFEGLPEAWADWRVAAEADARRALAARDWAAAEPRLAALQRAPGGAALAAPLARDLTFGRQQEQYLATASPASELVLVDRVQPGYPLGAAQRNVEGWVDLEFVVGTDGVPRNLTIAAAEPAGYFEQSALTAVERYRYQPFERDGRVYERRVRLRVRFTLR
jgi:protein TonB